jgi:hypothetical protein
LPARRSAASCAWLGVEQETLDEAEQLAANYQELVSEPDRIAPLLAPLGWVFHL